MNYTVYFSRNDKLLFVLFICLAYSSAVISCLLENFCGFLWALNAFGMAIATIKRTTGDIECLRLLFIPFVLAYEIALFTVGWGFAFLGALNLADWLACHAEKTPNISWYYGESF